MSEHTPKLEQCVEETVEGSEKSQLVLHSKKLAMISEGLSLEADLLASSQSSPSSSFKEKSFSSDHVHAPKIERQDKQRDKEGADLELGTKIVSKELMATMDTPTVECSSDTSKTGHSTRTKRKYKTATRKRQHGELRLMVSLFCS